jgi:hypothetical protein
MALAKEKKPEQNWKEDKYDLNNSFHKQLIKEFEKQYKGKTLNEIFIQLGYIRLDESLTELVVDGAYIEEIHDVKEKYKALGRLEGRRDYMSKQSLGFDAIIKSTPIDKIGDLVIGLKRYLERTPGEEKRPANLLLKKMQNKIDEYQKEKEVADLVPQAGGRVS